MINHCKVFLVKDSFGSSVKKVVEHSYEATNLDSSTPATINFSLQVTIHKAPVVDFSFRQFSVILVSTLVISVYFMLFS